MILLLLFITGLFAGTVDAIAGGGGLICLPILLGLGVPPHVAFGTNKLQGTIGTLAAAQRYYRHGLISAKSIYRGLAFGLVGSFLGAMSVQIINSHLLRNIIPYILLSILLYTVFSPRLNDQDHAPRMRESWFYLFFGFGLGFYDGFFGPGTGSFWLVALTFFLGYNIIKATAYTKVFNLNSSVVATLCFMVGGNIDYRFALCMAAGQLIGGRLGAHLAITRGARLIRPLFICVVSVTIASLAYKTYLGSALFTRITQQFGTLPQILAAISIATSIVLVYSKRKANSRQ
jgi:uncharacterized membrane protein YfcA